jgi:hypothetical protein
MTEKEKTSPSGDSNNSTKNSSEQGDQQLTPLISPESLIQRLDRGIEARARFVESHLNTALAFQIRSLRGDKWTQTEFAEKLGIKHANNVSARLENPNYGKHTLTTLKKIATACDVGLVVWFVPFGRLVDWVTGTPHTDNGLSPSFYDIPTFCQEFGHGKAGPMPLDVSETNTSTRQPVPKGINADEDALGSGGFPPLGDLGSLSASQAA